MDCRRKTLLILALLGASACAKVGDPLPPVVQPPPTIADLHLVERPGQIQVLFSLPPINLEWVEIFRECGPSGPQERLRLVARQAWDELSESPTEPGFFVHTQSRQAQPCRYAVRFIDTQGRVSDFSNRVETGP